ncbi:EcsC family protein [Lactococcus lactis]|uniref:Bacteriochlorophyll 4-vinyl reductase n=1 Tax=Lactococcus lactis subsp. lactis bv. diacetylactis TaxID=44688 RepID=A0A8B3F0P0_LACLL|nr:EcsC family protein [Lactococcus lactis]KST43162.1 bacteriochlorophyll 4-vinyl reductase [Lactococcus lactis subsp. lactis bv. diacetylactis]MCT3142883.1 bacteriochlorophyll 4-vinyl reductase [Lactococcus lactis]MUV47982.1 bacteriochlorophyll 4-vinyl reductase [Lactococcus lactis]QNT21698.1 EcsC family protein [Lactococcus lactis subsp. lactis bv. diacetylactis]RKO29310.1 bacteriochlorophyll 4-vinyl reductase [Lactococcus lactis subsp. lactis bv. diacetylactis]
MEQNNESLALKVVNESLKLPFIKIDRSEFLIKKFGEQVDDIQKLIDEGPQVFFSKEELDESAKKVINANVLQSSSLSFASGLPGGFAMAATIPADIAQFYGYSLKLAQEISYIYGYNNMWSDQGELTEDAKNTLILYLGVMLGVTSAGAAVRILSNKMALQALKKIPQKALTKTIYYPIIKKVMAIFGTKLTKATFAKGVSKFIPLFGGAVSGTMNYISLKPMANRLKDELGKNINYTTKDFEQDIKILNDEDVIITTSDVEYDDENYLKQLEKLSDLLEKNIITEQEFQKMKKSIIDKL